MVLINTVIPTVESRIDLASKLAFTVGGSLIVDPVGDGTEQSSNDNHVRAMLSAGKYSDWTVVLEDDADPIDDFLDILHSQLEEIKDKDCIVSLYLGRMRPSQIQPTIERTIRSVPSTTSWLQTSDLHWGVGVCIPTKLVDSVSSYVVRSTRPWDQAVGMWARTNRLPVLYTWPSLVDHVDVETTITHKDGQPRPAGRKAWSVGKPVPQGTISMIK